jgi:hypothetical protein
MFSILSSTAVNNWQHIETVIKMQPEAALRNFFFKCAVCGCHDAYIHLCDIAWNADFLRFFEAIGRDMRLKRFTNA